VIRLSAVAAALVLVAAAAGCEKDEKEKKAAGKACGPAPTALAGKPKLPAAFPTPDGVTYTSSTEKGPSTVVTGFREGDIDGAFEAYKDAFPKAGYDVTKDEHEDVDAEVNFAGGQSDGQVKLLQTCKDRTSITITARPK
jgi:hypothetical protein